MRAKDDLIDWRVSIHARPGGEEVCHGIPDHDDDPIMYVRVDRTTLDGENLDPVIRALTPRVLKRAFYLEE